MFAVLYLRCLIDGTWRVGSWKCESGNLGQRSGLEIEMWKLLTCKLYLKQGGHWGVCTEREKGGPRACQGSQVGEKGGTTTAGRRSGTQETGGKPRGSEILETMAGVSKRRESHRVQCH